LDVTVVPEKRLKVGTALVTIVIAIVAYASFSPAATTVAAQEAIARCAPQGLCFEWNARLIALHVISDAVIAAAALTIPFLLFWFIRKRPDLPFAGIVWMFGLFIFWCGTTHALEIWTVWQPAFWLLGAVKAITATAAALTVVMLAPRIFKATGYISPTDLIEHSEPYLQFVASASESLADATTREELFASVLKTVTPELADGMVMQFVDSAERLRVAHVRASPETSDLLARYVGTANATLGGASLSALAIRTGKTQIAKAKDDNVLRSIGDDRAILGRDWDVAWALAIPLFFDNGARGAFLIFRTHLNRGRFSDAEIVLLETLARRAVAATKNLDELERLEHAASHDNLTGLANRSIFVKTVNATLARLQPGAVPSAAILYLDLDRFKLVNDSFGHSVGDLLLVAIARRLERCMRSGDTLARLSGDEFVILLPDISSEEEAENIADRLLGELVAPFVVNDHEIFSSGSIGVALASADYHTCDELVRDADIAMYRAKTSGRRRCATFVPEMRSEARKRLELDAELRRALERNELEVFYQPIVSLASGHIDGFEALVRWDNPVRGSIAPMDFIPIAEETGSIVELGAYVLRRACAQARAWQRMSPDYASISINVNVSVKELGERNYVEHVMLVLAETGCDPKSLHLEITESVLMEKRALLGMALYELRAHGVRIDMDDFGTGYSSLSYLHSFPIDALKIDRSFVSGMGNDLATPEIVKTILALAANLHVDVVAEGVETLEQEIQLRRLGCNKAQGYQFARPLNVSAATALLERSMRAAV